MNIPALLGCFLLVVTAASSASAEQDIGDPLVGFEIAAESCAFCHAVLPEQAQSPLPGATRFEDIANTPGMTARALYVWMRTSHPLRTMPLIVLEREELGDVIAYIRSLSHQQ
jgi:mono/diheme cytochrome c family protein